MVSSCCIVLSMIVETVTGCLVNVLLLAFTPNVEVKPYCRIATIRFNCMLLIIARNCVMKAVDIEIRATAIVYACIDEYITIC